MTIVLKKCNNHQEQKNGEIKIPFCESIHFKKYCLKIHLKNINEMIMLVKSIFLNTYTQFQPLEMTAQVVNVCTRLQDVTLLYFSQNLPCDKTNFKNNNTTFSKSNML